MFKCWSDITTWKWLHVNLNLLCLFFFFKSLPAGGYLHSQRWQIKTRLMRFVHQPRNLHFFLSLLLFFVWRFLSLSLYTLSSLLQEAGASEKASAAPTASVWLWPTGCNITEFASQKQTWRWPAPGCKQSPPVCSDSATSSSTSCNAPDKGAADCPSLGTNDSSWLTYGEFTFQEPV